jgi:uncharacterized protein
VILTDAGPLIALINRNDPHHAECAAALSRLPGGPLVTTWPAFTEAMHLLFRGGRYAAQRELWRMISGGRLILHNLTEQQISRSAQLMEKYSDRPMDWADATLGAIAEELPARTIFSIDKGFHLYRLADDSVLTVVP